jgi:hypothetical protein
MSSIALSKDTLVTVCVIFNPHGFKSRIQLYKEFAPYIEFSGSKLMTVEIAFNDRPFEVTTADNPWNLQLRTTDVLWHKERGLNLGLQKVLTLIPDLINVCMIDADVRFVNPHWANEAILALDHYTIIQLFSEAVHLSPKYEHMWHCFSRLYHFVNKGFCQDPPKPLKYVANGHPGLAWAFRVETLNQLGGLPDWAVTGSGDTHLANAIMGDAIFNAKPGMSAGFERALKRYGEKCDKHVKKNIGYINGICTHYWHGRSEVRGYDRRWDITCFHKFDPAEDIYLAANGLYSFTGNKKEMENDLRLSTSYRNEDSIDV